MSVQGKYLNKEVSSAHISKEADYLVKKETYISQKSDYLSAKEAYEKRIKDQIKAVMLQLTSPNPEGSLSALKAEAEEATGNARARFDTQVDELQQQVDITKANYAELGEASEAAWKKLKGGMEGAWKSLGTVRCC